MIGFKMNTRIDRILFNGKKNVLWGAGRNGIDLLFSMIEKDIDVTCFCDSDTDKQYIRIYNKLVIAPQDVLAKGGEYNIIVTLNEGCQRDSILETLEANGINEYILGEDIGITSTSLCMNREYLYNLIRDSYVHEIIIYGTDCKAVKIVEVLKALDVDIKYIIDEIDYGYRLKQFNIDVKPLYCVLDEIGGKYKVIIPSALDGQKKDKMYDLGLKVRRDYNFFDDYRLMLPRSSILDPNLGYSFRINDNQIPGFVQFGRQEDYKIVTLGNSTTDSLRFSFKSWSEILYEKLKAEGYKTCVICGGCIGYQTSQELIKLIRDVLPMKPDMVVDYSGYNDALLSGTMPEYFFVHQYQIKLFNQISQDHEYERYGEQYIKNNDGPSFGVSSNLTSWEHYINNMKAMKGVCDIFEIEFLGFLQPWLATKPVYSIQEREMIANGLDIFLEKYGNCILSFYKNRLTIDSSYITDLTQIFNQYDEVYIDQVHVNEVGNAIIADNIMKVIKEKIVKEEVN